MAVCGESVEGGGASTVEEKERKADGKDGEKGKEKEAERLDDVPHAHHDRRGTPPVDAVRPTTARKRRRREGDEMEPDASVLRRTLGASQAPMALLSSRGAADASEATAEPVEGPHDLLEATPLRKDGGEGEKNDGNALESGNKERQHHCSSTLPVQRLPPDSKRDDGPCSAALTPPASPSPSNGSEQQQGAEATEGQCQAIAR
jgi:hypothetical protein